jgi:hypothetical protein
LNALGAGEMTMSDTLAGYRRAGATVVAALCVALSAGCAGADARDEVPVAAAASLASPGTVTTIVPDVVGEPATSVGKQFGIAGLTVILRYEPGIVAAPGAVVSTEPPAGTVVVQGSVVTVIVAGPSARTLQDLVDAHRETYVGLSVDGNGATVAIYRRANVEQAIAELDAVAEGRLYRVQLCDRSYAELSRIMVELGRRDFVPGAKDLGFSFGIDARSCAVLLSIGGLDRKLLPELLERYEGALVVSFEGAEHAALTSPAPAR